MFDFIGSIAYIIIINFFSISIIYVMIYWYVFLFDVIGRFKFRF